ncbi:hypothetical protein ASF21_14960 [Arthrobacter sp. Leaf234]|uniref:hypothetical protein n=1 Tax=Arthrobacter sp. Leaf234 TaxID=1736303 RepID=UPI0006F7E71C|nr:hypothetical protein [Arthrobacter sp. Leaf234]KQN96675.1 hypothetical protein ASF21_14960 [Arthrobacter sp. Leaf234]
MIPSSPYRSGPVDVRFEYQAARKETRHLIVIFTSIRKSNALLDFLHDKPLLKHNRAHLLWIYDDFDADYSYYACRNREFDIESGVTALVEVFKEALGLADDECTTAGMSKGASAAIRIGIKANCGNIVASSPQIAIGTYLKNRKRFPIIEHMAGSAEPSDVEWLNDLVPQAIRSDERKERHMYLLTSPYDPHCIDYLEPLQQSLNRYTNFNLISTASNLARNHAETLQYNVPLMVSILGILSEGLHPAFGATSNGHGFDGSGHRDRHLLLAKKFGGIFL